MTTDAVFLKYGRLRTPFTTTSVNSVVVVTEDWVANQNHAYARHTQTLPLQPTIMPSHKAACFE